MKIPNRIAGAYFSPTGTTRSVVSCLANELGRLFNIPVVLKDFTVPAGRIAPLQFEGDDLVILGTPVYAGRVPNVLLKYLALLSGKKAAGIPIVLFGNRAYDDALIELRDILERGGVTPIAAGAFVGEHSFSRILAAGRPDKKDIEDVKRFAFEVFNGWASIQEPAPIQVPGTPYPYRGYFSPRNSQGNSFDFKKIVPFTDGNCTGCGTCARICPMGSIPMENPKTLAGICIKCCACVKLCPTGAKHFGHDGYQFHATELEEKYATRHPNEWFTLL